MLFVENLKPMKVYRKPMYLPTVEGDKKKHSAVLLLTPNYESSKSLIQSPLLINKLRFQSYYIEKDLTYFISSKVMNKVDDVTETYVRDYSELDFYHSLCEMSASERDKLKDSDFGLPKKRKYPLNDKAHVKSAIKFFNYVDSEDEEELARNLNNAIDKFYDSGEKLDLHIGDNNRFKKYYHESVVTEVKSSKMDMMTFKSDKELYDYVSKNVTYKSNSVYDINKIESEHCGDCHDQAGYLYYQLKKLGYKTGRLFAYEYYDGCKKGGKTHTLCWYIKSGKYYWMETAWDDMKGIHECGSSVGSVQNLVCKNWKFSGKNDRLNIVKCSGVQNGMTLAQYVSKVTPKKEPKDYFQKGRIINSESAIFESTIEESSYPSSSNERGYYNINGTYNCLVDVEGIDRPLRGRGEILILDKTATKIYLVFKNSDEYKVPGGGFEPDESHLEGVVREAKEEARIEVVGAYDTGVRYVEMYNDDVDKTQADIDPENRFYGAYTEVYVGTASDTYDGDLNTLDADDKMTKGKFYPISEVFDKLKKEHQEALSVTLNESLDLTKIRFWHMENKRPGFNPKYLSQSPPLTSYYNTIDNAISVLNPDMIGKDKVDVYAYTIGEDNDPIYVGVVTVYNTSNGKRDWEWSERSDVSDGLLDYYRDEVHRKLLQQNEE